LLSGVITNGRVMSVEEGELFSQVDFESVESNELKKRASHISSTIHQQNPTLKGFCFVLLIWK
jgi:hypothetical protein